MKTPAAVSLFRLLTLAAAASFLSGCADLDCFTGERESLVREKIELEKKLSKIPPRPILYQPGPGGFPPPPAPRKHLKLSAGPIGAFPTFTGIPNPSKGKFIAQVTVTYSELEGLILGESAGGLRFQQPQWSGGSRRRFLGARPDESVNGFKVFMGDTNGTAFGTIKSFPDIYRIDLQIEQTDDFLIFRARPTLEPVVAGGWTTIFVENSPVDPAPFTIAVGLSRVEKGGTFYFTNFAIEGPGIGGEAEGPILLKVRETVEAFQSAKTQIAAAAPNLPGALADIDTAIAAHDEAHEMLEIAMVDGTLQKGSTSIAASKSLEKLNKDLAAIRTGVATLDPKKAKSQVAKIDKAIRTEQGVMSNLLGWKAPPIGAIPQDIFSLRVP